MRSREPSRLEGFSDAVFGFALTLLVVFEARSGIAHHSGTACVGLLSIAIAWIGGDRWARISGMSYAPLGVVHGVLGWIHGRKRGQLQAEANVAV